MKKSGITILIIEDESLLLQAISRKLSTMGFEPITATSAKQALDYLHTFPEPPDAIWLDYYLGDINGYEFMEKIKADPKLAEIPVFVVSNSAGDEKKKQLISLGAKEYFLKANYRLEELGNIILDYFERGDKK